MTKFAVSIDLDEGWEQTMILVASTLKEAKKEAIGILYDLRPDDTPEGYCFSIYEISDIHNHDMEEFMDEWEQQDKVRLDMIKKYKEETDRDHFERLKKKFGE